MYLRNAWYVAAWDHEIQREPLARTLLDTPVVLWRTEDGTPVAFEDRCCHRQAPLSAGKIVGDRLQCGYHGLMFDRSGACVEVPSQTKVPPDARVKSYPMFERNHWVWIWMGDPEDADDTLIPDTYWHDSSDWVSIGDKFSVDCNYQLLIDIQLDNTHSRFVHPDTLGNAGSLRHSPKVIRHGEQIHNTREMRDSDPPLIYTKSTGHNGNADVWVAWTYTPRAGVITFDTGIAELNSGVFEGDRSKAYQMFNTHGITPETDGRCHHFWVTARDFALDDETVSQTLAALRDTFLEDVAMVEAQQRTMDSFSVSPRIDVNADQPTIQARNLVAQMMEAERG
jgi:vanillate O-demethylase monooxygenase subunit